MNFQLTRIASLSPAAHLFSRNKRDARVNLIWILNSRSFEKVLSLFQGNSVCCANFKLFLNNYITRHISQRNENEARYSAESSFGEKGEKSFIISFARNPRELLKREMSRDAARSPTWRIITPCVCKRTRARAAGWEKRERDVHWY